MASFVVLEAPSTSLPAAYSALVETSDGTAQRQWTVEAEGMVASGAKMAGHTLLRGSASPAFAVDHIVVRVRAFRSPEGRAFIDVKVHPSDPGDDDWGSAQGQPEQLSMLVFQALQELAGRTVPLEARISISIEILVSALQFELENESSDLRRALDEAHIEVAFLRGQLHALNEAKAMGRTRIMKAVIGVVGAVLLAATTGAVGGATQALTERRVASASEAPSVGDLIEQCQAIDGMLDD